MHFLKFFYHDKDLDMHLDDVCAANGEVIKKKKAATSSLKRTIDKHRISTKELRDAAKCSSHKLEAVNEQVAAEDR